MIENKLNIGELKKLPISTLILIMLNDKYPDNIRKYSEIELRSRMKNLYYTIDNSPIDDLIHEESKTIAIRGLDFDDYLLSPNPEMQKLMELYFVNFVEKDENLPLLLSEYHFYNSTKKHQFFDIICYFELENINQRLQGDMIGIEKASLLYALKILEERKNNQGKHNAAYDYLDDILKTNGHGISYGYKENITEEERYEILSSKTKHLKRNLITGITDHLPKSFDTIYGHKIIKEDASTLKEQKLILLNQAKSGYVVDYKPLRRTLKK